MKAVPPHHHLAAHMARMFSHPAGKGSGRAKVTYITPALNIQENCFYSTYLIPPWPSCIELARRLCPGEMCRSGELHLNQGGRKQVWASSLNFQETDFANNALSMEMTHASVCPQLHQVALHQSQWLSEIWKSGLHLLGVTEYKAATVNSKLQGKEKSN